MNYKGVMLPKISFYDLGPWQPARDASWYFHAEVVVDGVRYPARLMIEGVALADLEAEFGMPHDDIVEELYRRELRTLIASGQLKPAGRARRINTVLFSSGKARAQVEAGDIVVDDALVKLRRAALSLRRNRQPK